jgi:hypothetical protein
MPRTQPWPLLQGSMLTPLPACGRGGLSGSPSSNPRPPWTSPPQESLGRMCLSAFILQTSSPQARTLLFPFRPHGLHHKTALLSVCVHPSSLLLSNDAPCWRLHATHTDSLTAPVGWGPGTLSRDLTRTTLKGLVWKHRERTGLRAP